MIKVNSHILSNGLRLVHSDSFKTSMACVNVLYNVGARDEEPEHTGIAHLMEHLMFSGSKNAPSYDNPLQEAGAQNYAYDYTINNGVILEKRKPYQQYHFYYSRSAVFISISRLFTCPSSSSSGLVSMFVCLYVSFIVTIIKSRLAGSFILILLSSYFVFYF